MPHRNTRVAIKQAINPGSKCHTVTHAQLSNKLLFIDPKLKGTILNVFVRTVYDLSPHRFTAQFKLNIRINPISAGVLENQDMLGLGVKLTPPSKSHVLCPNMTNDTLLESSCALLLESANKFANLKKLNLLSQNTVLLYVSDYTTIVSINWLRRLGVLH